MITAIDTNVLLDILTGTPVDAAGSAAAIKAARLASILSISTVVYAELASNFRSRDRVADFIQLLGCKVEPMEEAAAYLGGQLFMQYKMRGGSRSRILPDFLIAAHAQLHADRLLTRDKRFFKETFPRLKAVAPSDLV